MRKPTEKQIDARINRVYGQACSGVQVDIMDIAKVFARGREIIATGADDITLGVGLREFTEKLAGGYPQS